MTIFVSDTYIICNDMDETKKQMPAKYVITVGRTFGSGGRALGKLIADKLGIAYYDKELLSQAAAKAGMSAEYFEQNDERAPSFFSGIFSFNHGYNPVAYFAGPSSISSDGIYQAQCEFIHEIAEKGPCVIVGRTSDYVLRDMDNVVNIFVHAPIECCVKRIVERSESLSEERARAMAERTNKVRSAFYNFYTDKVWGAASSYDLTIDSSAMTLDKVAEYIIEYVRLRLAK